MHETYEKYLFYHDDTSIQVPADSISLGSLGQGHTLTETNIL